MTVSVVIADDHAVVREGVRTVLSEDLGVEIAGETGDGPETLAVVEAKRPDILILDLTMPSLSGFDVIEKVRSVSPDTAVVVLSIHSDQTYALRCFAMGALGYVVKNAGATEIANAVRAALRGRRYVSPSLPEALIGMPDDQDQVRKGDPYHSLTTREKDVLYLVGDGLTNEEIGVHLGISRRTVEGHRARLLTKVPVDSTAALIRYALEKDELRAERAPDQR